VRILIAGLGAIGQRHARNLRALRGDDLELLAYRRRRLSHVVTDTLQRDDSRNVEADLGVRTFLDLDTALAQQPDAVFVCTPSSQHLEIAQRSAAAGCHLFIEKPVAHTMDGLDDLQSTVAANGVKVLVGCQWRFHPCVRWLRDRLAEQALGTLTDATFDYAEYLPDWHPYEDYRTSYAARAVLGGGVVLTQIHDYDLAWWLFGHPSSAVATGGRCGDLEIDVEDTVDARLDGGSIPVRVRQSMATRPPRRTISVSGTRKSVVVDLLAPRVEMTAGEGTEQVDFAGYRRNQMFLDEADHFLACLEGKAEPAIPLDEGIAVLRLALEVKDAIA